MGRMTLPHHLTPGLMETVRKKLRALGWLTSLCQIATGAALPLCECYVVNMITGTQIAALIATYWHLLWLLIVIHAVLLIALISSSQPLPQFLVEFDALYGQLDGSKNNVSVLEDFNLSWSQATLAAYASLLAIERMDSVPVASNSEAFANVLDPWIKQRSSIFGFRGEEMHNFAVYLYHPTEKVLKKEYFVKDDRLSSTNRSWEPGKGLVGICYSQQKLVFIDDTSVPDVWISLNTGREEDKKHYKSLIAAPIIINGTVEGVFIVTSNKAQQFVRDLHDPIMTIATAMLVHAFRHRRSP